MWTVTSLGISCAIAPTHASRPARARPRRIDSILHAPGKARPKARATKTTVGYPKFRSPGSNPCMIAVRRIGEVEHDAQILCRGGLSRGAGSARDRIIACSNRKAVVEAAGVQAPRFEVDPMWPKPLPNHWVIGADDRRRRRRQRPHLDHPSRRLARSQGTVRHLESAGCGMLRRRAAGSGIQRGRRPDRALGRPGRRLRLAGVEPRHRRRLQRQRLDRRQRPRHSSPPPLRCRTDESQHGRRRRFTTAWS